MCSVPMLACVTLGNGRITSLNGDAVLTLFQSRDLCACFLSPKSRFASISVSVGIAMAFWSTSPLEASNTDVSIGMEALNKVIFPVVEVEDIQDRLIEQMNHGRNNVSFFMRK